MSFTKYLSNRVFFAQLIAAFAIVAVLTYSFFHWITYVTNHGEEITVPNLAELTSEQVEEKFSDLDLFFEIIDTVDYNPDFPKLSVVQQEPTSGSKVKGGRTIYIKLNANTFTKVAIPDLIERTYRQALPTLKAIGLEVGEISYIPYLGKDMVLNMLIDGKEVKAGTKVLKATKIDLVLGDGKVIFDESELEPTIETETDSVQ
ncbi:MAG: beta-lactam-binding protein with PASTA domain [Flavobacterium sp.]|jgi:beta-lactam-binding protein with PASTA domain